MEKVPGREAVFGRRAARSDRQAGGRDWGSRSRQKDGNLVTAARADRKNRSRWSIRSEEGRGVDLDFGRRRLGADREPTERRRKPPSGYGKKRNGKG